MYAADLDKLNAVAARLKCGLPLAGEQQLRLCGIYDVLVFFRAYRTALTSLDRLRRNPTTPRQMANARRKVEAFEDQFLTLSRAVQSGRIAVGRGSRAPFEAKESA